MPVVFSVYWIFQNKRSYQNVIVLIASYIFYGFWNWKFLALIIISTITDYLVGLKINQEEEQKTKKIILYSSLIINLGILFVYKYYDFFIISWLELCSSFGYEISSKWTIELILPLGISFYTFQTMSYSIDVYFGKINPTKNFITFASYVSFFPQLIAGPIERASNVIPQLEKGRTFQYKQSVEGLRLIFWGLLKKVVIADYLMSYRSDFAFTNYSQLDGGTLLLGLIYFAIQIYCDFSGYSDIAIGTAKLFGIEIISNFNFPYFSRNPFEFWERWHISLSNWIRDYLYFPIAMHYMRIKVGRIGKYKSHIITMALMGIWHGANWKFLGWGIYWAIIIIVYSEIRPYLLTIKKSFILKFLEILSMFSITCASYIFFRSESLTSAFDFFYCIISEFSFPQTNRGGMIFVIPFLLIEYIIKNDERNPINIHNKFHRWFVYLFGSFLIYFCWADNKNIFIYFQF